MNSCQCIMETLIVFGSKKWCLLITFCPTKCVTKKLRKYTQQTIVCYMKEFATRERVVSIDTNMTDS